MPGVFTIYSCGTAFNRQRLDELTANLANRTIGADWRVNDGPGSSDFAPESARGRAPKDDERPASEREHELADEATRLGPAAQLRGIVTGHGWDANVAHSLEALHARARSGPEPLATVNLLGWSRGAITCHMIANALASDRDPRLSRLRVNIFAVDPVAGTGNRWRWHSDKRNVPDTVNEYVAIPMEDERRFIMKPTTAAPHGAGSRRLLYPMPGDHSTGVLIHESPVAEIVQHLAHNFLTRHGTQLRSHVRLAPEKLCELYAIVRLTLPDYRARSVALLQTLGLQRGNPENPYRDRFFVNAHHLDMFNAAHPVLANVLHARSLSQYKTQLAQLAPRFPATYKWATEICGLG